MPYSPTLQTPLATAAARLGIPDPAWLRSLIQAESGWNARAYNASSGATGLIQWIPRVMRDFGFLPSAVSSKIPASGALTDALKKEVSAAFLTRYPDAEKQLLGPVVDYLARYKPYPTEKSLYLAVFFPAYRGKSLDTPFPDSVKAANPGISTVGDYVAFVQSKGRGATAAGTGVIALLAAATGIYIATR